MEYLKPHSINYITIDFSDRLEAGVKHFFKDNQILKCTFHACQLLTRGMLKELTRLKNEKYANRIKEYLYIRRVSLKLEKGAAVPKELSLQLRDSKFAWELYLELRAIFSAPDPHKIQTELKRFVESDKVRSWKGGEDLRKRCMEHFPKRALTVKGIKYFRKHIYRAWRGVIRALRKDLEGQKSKFNDAKFLILKNPINMNGFERRALRRALKTFPWLRPIRRLLVKFYYQFRVPPAKRVSLKFLLHLLSEESHVRLKSAVHTLIKYEAHVFRFQIIYQQHPQLKDCKGLKVVNETSMRKVNRLYQTQCGMRTLDNFVMRTSHYLDCPIIVAPRVLE
jgi:hypothetical protein